MAVNPAELLGLLDGLVSASGPGANLSTALLPVGQKFLALAVLLTIMNDFLQFWILGGAQDLLARMARLFIVTSIPLTLMAGSNWVDLNNTLVTFFQSDVTQALGAATGSGPSQIISGTMRDIMLQTNLPAAATESEFSVWNPATWGDAGNAMTGVLVTYILKAIVFIGLGLMLLAMIVAAYVPLIALKVGVIFGPLLVAWLPFEPLSDMARTWFRFMIVNAMAFAVSILLLLLSKEAVAGVIKQVAEMLNDGAASGLLGAFAGIAIVIAVMLFVAYVLLQADEIASSLVGHSAIGGGHMGRAIGGGMGKATGFVGKGASSVAGKGAVSGITGAGKGANAVGTMAQKSANAAGVARAIQGKAGSSAMVTAGNAARTVGSGAQKVTAKAASVLSRPLGKSK